VRDLLVAEVGANLDGVGRELGAEQAVDRHASLLTPCRARVGRRCALRANRFVASPCPSILRRLFTVPTPVP
jgi:hypothetical protein